MLEGKTGLKTSEKIICVCFIILLLAVIILPPVLREIKAREDAKAIEEAKNNSKAAEILMNGTLKLICNMYNSDSTSDMSFYYNTDGYLQKYIINTVIDFGEVTDSNTEAFTNQVAICNNTGTLYANVVGYERNCIQKSNRFTTNIVYNLNTFVDATVTNSNGKEEKITSNYSKIDKVEDIKDKLVSSGYTCTLK